MRAPLLVAGSLTLLSAGPGLETDYTRPRLLRTTAETSFELETTSLEMEVDGEPVDHPMGGGGGGSDGAYTVVTIDRVVERDGGRPRLVHRTFEEAAGSATMYFGEQSFDQEMDSPLSGATLAIAVDDDGEIDVSVEDGSEPDDESALEGHRPLLALDALLPTAAVEEGDSWEVGSADVAHALGLDVARALFPPSDPDEDSGDGRRGGRRGGGSSIGFLSTADWEGEVTLADADADWEGTPCVRLSVKLEAQGDLPEEMMRTRTRGGRRVAGPPNAARGNEYAAELEGSVWFSTELGRPLAAEFEGDLEMEITREMSRGDREMSMHMVREGTFEYRVEITEESTE